METKLDRLVKFVLQSFECPFSKKDSRLIAVALLKSVGWRGSEEAITHEQLVKAEAAWILAVTEE